MAHNIAFDIFARDHSHSGFNSAANNAEDAGRRVSKVGSIFGVVGKGIALAGAGITAGLGFAAVTGIKTAASMEQASVAFTTLLGSGQKAKSFLGELQQFAAATPFDFPGLVDASRQLLGAGASAKEVIPTLTAYGDAAGALGISQDRFNNIMLATTQAMSAGKLQAGDLLQMTEAGLPVWSLLSQAMHKPVSEIRNLSQQGKLLTKDVLPLLQKQMEKDYGGSMAKQSQTLAGIWSTLTDTLNMGLASAIQPMLPALKGLATNGIGFLSKAFAGFSKIIPVVGGYFSDFLNGLKTGDTAAADGLTGMTGVMDNLGVIAGRVFNWLRTNVPIIFGEMKTVIGNIASVVLPLFSQGWSAAQGPLQSVGTFITGTMLPGIVKLSGWIKQHATLVRSLVVAILSMYAAYKVITIATKLFAAAQWALNLSIDANPIGLIVLALAGLAGGLIYAYKHSQTFRDIVKTVLGDVKTAFDTLWRFIKPLFDMWAKQLQIVGDAGRGLWTVLQTAFRLIVDATLTTFGAIIHGAANAFGWVPGLGGKLKDGAKAFDRFKTDVNNALANTNHSFALNADATRAYNVINAAVRYANTRSAMITVGATNGRGGMPGAGNTPGYASGTPWAPPGMAWVGENGPELMQMRGGERVIPSRQSAQMGGGESDQNLTVQFVLDGKVIQQSLLRVKRRNGGTQLGLA